MPTEVKEVIENNYNKILKISTISLVVFFLLLASLTAVAKSYEGQSFPHLKVGNKDVGKKDFTAVKQDLDELAKQLSEQGIRITLNKGNGEEVVQVPVEKVFDTTKAADEIMNYGKRGNILTRGLKVLGGLTGQINLELPSLAYTSQQAEILVKESVKIFEKPAVNADFAVTTLNPFTFKVTTSSPGVVFDYTGIGSEIIKAWEEGKVPEVKLSSVIDEPTISEADVRAMASSTATVFTSPILLTHFDSHTKRPYQWSISKQQLADWSEVKRNETGAYLAISSEAVAEFVSGTIKKVVDKAPSDAVFKLNATGTKATQFVGARPGVTVDLNATESNIEKVFAERREGRAATSTALVIATVDPKVKTEDTNNLGIKEILGYGYSSFSGSPRNRILNIKNAVQNKLNGTIVKPGEEFSLVNTLKPFTLEAGYLPELVILGNRITPEIAGGLCQVGTTMFRAAMNSGLAITARSNHGLVVSYYNDPSNGNPGTDATIYEPNPDFKFRNDTGHAVLISTEMNVSTGDLVFYVWGTNDGRKAHYTPPQVLSWIAAGPAQTIETSDLAPGKKECQGVHPGAVTTFNYIRVLTNGKKEVREFKSTYRAVPATCYVGRDPNAVPTGDTLPTDATNSTDPTTAVPIFDPADDLVPTR